MADLQGRKVFKVFNQDFIVDERYNVTKELGQGAYGIVWYVPSQSSGHTISYVQGRWTFIQQQDGPLYPQCICSYVTLQRSDQQPYWRRRCHQKSHQCFQQEDPCKAGFARD